MLQRNWILHAEEEEEDFLGGDISAYLLQQFAEGI
jgi:hypothetical protein